VHLVEDDPLQIAHKVRAFVQHRPNAQIERKKKRGRRMKERKKRREK
jgi:hypothetical protein